MAPHPASLQALGEHHNVLQFVLPHHPPEVPSCVGHGPCVGGRGRGGEGGGEGGGEEGGGRGEGREEGGGGDSIGWKG